MTEIDKLFENAGFIKKQCKDYSCTVCEQYNDCKKYPSFTTEKQLELIKLLGKRSSIGLDIFSDNETWFYFDYDGICFRYRADGETFEEALAMLVNIIWQPLTDQEKEEIRRILK